MQWNFVMVEICRTSSVNRDFLSLINELDKELVERYGENQADLDKNNVIGSTRNIVIAYNGQVPVGCGCYRLIDNENVEVKRIYVIKEFRGRGISKMILRELEEWAYGEGFKIATLETGKKQLEAINLYSKFGYKQIENFPPYIGNEMSLCMGKELTGY